MSAADLRTFLLEEYGIKNDEEFEMAVNASTGINLGMFTQPFKGGANNDKETSEISVA